VDGEHTEIARAPVKAAGTAPLKSAAQQLPHRLAGQAPMLASAPTADGFSKF
jgi:hypothetical protein